MSKRNTSIAAWVSRKSAGRSATIAGVKPPCAWHCACASPPPAARTPRIDFSGASSEPTGISGPKGGVRRMTPPRAIGDSADPAMPAKQFPIRQIALGPSDTIVEYRKDGTILIRSPHGLGRHPAKLNERLVHWARNTPERLFLAKRDASGTWRTLTYVRALALVHSLGQALLDRGLCAERPLVILSGNDLEHALLALAAMHVGVPYSPISPAYSLISTDHGKLRYILELLQAGLVFAANGEHYAKAIAAAVPPGCELVVTEAAPANRNATLFDALLEKPAGTEVAVAYAAVKPHTVGQIRFNSGSTGQPKGVINTQRMLCSNQEMLALTLPYLREVPPVLVDWLPWNHTFGANHNFGLALYNGGTLYIDDGRPVPGLFEDTVRNLREIAPTGYFNVT